MVDFDSSTILLAVLLYLPLFLYLWKIKKTALVRLFFITIFYSYMVGVASKTFFPIFLDNDTKQALGQNVWRNANLVPFIHLTAYDLKSSVSNIILFIPFGYLLPLLKGGTFRYIVSYGFLTSLVIEVLQVVIALFIGFTFRHFDVNDIVFNTTGAAFGYACYLIFAWLFQIMLRKIKPERNPFLDYIDTKTK